MTRPGLVPRPLDVESSPLTTKQPLFHALLKQTAENRALWFTLVTFCHIFLHRLQRNNSHIAQALESCEKDFDALLARLEITRQDIELVLSPLFEAQHWRHSNSAVSKNEAVKTFESKEKENKVDFKERENYGDMEELD